MQERADFLIVGAHALAIHGSPRATGDLDIWVRPTRENADRVWQALGEFGAPAEVLGIEQADLATPGMVVQFGMPPRRIDLLTEISGVEFEAAWSKKIISKLHGMEIPFLDREHLVQNKRASGRPKDLADIAMLEADSA